MYYAYNAFGEQVWTKDQAGNVLETVYDTAGRETAVKATTVASGFDAAVERIATTYTDLGQARLVTQYDDPTAGSVVNEVKFRYDDWGNVDLIEQDRNSAVGASGSVDDYETAFTYAKRTSGRNTISRKTVTLPDGVVVDYEATTTGVDYQIGRVKTIKVGTTTVCTYKYLGLDQPVSTTYNEADVFSRVHGTTTGSYPDLDVFNRLTTNDWTKDLTTDQDIYKITIAYDEGSNITSIEDHVHVTGAAGAGNGLFDVAYSIDGLNRVSRAKEGHWDGSAVADANARRDEVWTLTPAGAMKRMKLDLDGDLNYNEAGEMDDARAFTLANELKTRDTNNSAPVEHSLTHDKAGNLTDDGDDYTYTYDAFGRVREVRARSGSALVAEYKYDGLGQRIGWHYDADADGTVENSADDPWYLFAYDDRWRIVNTYRLADWSYSVSNPAAGSAKERFVYHAAGLGGWGGSSYIDSVILRDRDMSTAWTAASDGTMESRHYYCQNWRGDVSVIVDDDGDMVEWIKYSAYGVPFALPAGDTDSDGDWDTADSTAMGDGGTYDVRQDADLDGDNDASDATYAAVLHGGTSLALGRGVLTSSSIANRKGYAGCFLVSVAASAQHQQLV